MHFAWVPFGASYRFLLFLSFSCLLSSLAHHSGAVGTEAVSSTYAAMSVRYAALAVFLSVDVTTASELAAAVAVSTTGTTPTFVFHLATRPVHRFEGPDMEQLAAVLAQFASAVAAGAGNGGSAMGAGGGPGGPGMGGGGGRQALQGGADGGSQSQRGDVCDGRGHGAGITFGTFRPWWGSCRVGVGRASWARGFS